METFRALRLSSTVIFRFVLRCLACRESISNGGTERKYKLQFNRHALTHLHQRDVFILRRLDIIISPFLGGKGEISWCRIFVHAERIAHAGTNNATFACISCRPTSILLAESPLPPMYSFSKWCFHLF